MPLKPMWLYDLVRGIWAWCRHRGCRRGEALGLALLGVCAAGSQPAPGSDDQTKGITISLGAEDVEYLDDDQTLTLSGQVSLRASGLPGPVGEVEMKADRLTVALRPGDVSAEGRTIVQAQGLEVTGEAVRYNLRSHAFHAEKARSAIVLPVRGREVTVFAQSELVESDGTQAQLQRACVTTCEHDRPHYALHVRRATISPARDRVTIRGGAVELYGVRIPLIPKLNKSLGLDDRRNELDLEFPGYSATDGWYYPFTRRFTDPEAALQARVNLRLAQNNIIAGRVITEYTRGGLYAWVTGVRRDQRPDDITGRLLYSALPELGARVSRNIGSSVAILEFAGGYYREQDLVTRRRATDSAATINLTWDWRAAGSDRKAPLRVGIGVRASLYGGGSSYRTVHLHGGGNWRVGRRANVGLELRHHFIAGHTPFEFDDVDIRTEALGELNTPLFGPWGLSLVGRYDLNERRLRDYDIGFHFRHHCLTWTLRYNGAHDRFGIGVNLTDFTSGGRPRPTRAPKGSIGAGGAVAIQPPYRQELHQQYEPSVAAYLPFTGVPTEHALSPAHRQRAPDTVRRFEFAPPPSLRVGSLLTAQ